MVDGYEILHQLKTVVYPTHHRGIQGDAGFLPSISIHSMTLQVNLLVKNVETDGQRVVLFVFFGEKKFGNSEQVFQPWGKLLGTIWYLTSRNNFLGATECDESARVSPKMSTLACHAVWI